MECAGHLHLSGDRDPSQLGGDGPGADVRQGELRGSTACQGFNAVRTGHSGPGAGGYNDTGALDAQGVFEGLQAHAAVGALGAGVVGDRVLQGQVCALAQVLGGGLVIRARRGCFYNLVSVLVLAAFQDPGGCDLVLLVFQGFVDLVQQGGVGVGVCVVVLQVLFRGVDQGFNQGTGNGGGVSHNDGDRNIFFHGFHTGNGDKVGGFIGVLVAVQNILAPVLRVIGIFCKHADLTPEKSLLQLRVGELAGNVNILAVVVFGGGQNDHHRIDQAGEVGNRSAQGAAAQLNGGELDPGPGQVFVVQRLSGVGQLWGIKHGFSLLTKSLFGA